MLTLSFEGELPTGRHHYERIKDRMSYTHQIFKFDLTQVKIPETTNMVSITRLWPRMIQDLTFGETFHCICRVGGIKGQIRS